MEDKTLDESRTRTHQARADIYAGIDRAGDRLAKKNGWTHIDGADAVRYFLMQKHHWTPTYVMQMSYEELRFAVAQEPELGRDK